MKLNKITVALWILVLLYCLFNYSILTNLQQHPLWLALKKYKSDIR